MELPSINIGEYLHISDPELKDKYDFAIKYSKQSEAKDILCFGDLTKKTFGEVKDLQQQFSEKDYFVKFITQCEKLLYLDVFTFFAYYNYVINEVSRVNSIESQLLGHEANGDEINANIDKLNEMGVGIQIDTLALGQVWMYETIRGMNYEDCLYKLVLEKRRSDYQRDYQNIMLNKSKNG